MPQMNRRQRTAPASCHDRKLNEESTKSNQKSEFSFFDEKELAGLTQNDLKQVEYGAENAVGYIQGAVLAKQLANDSESRAIAFKFKKQSQDQAIRACLVDEMCPRDLLAGQDTCAGHVFVDIAQSSEVLWIFKELLLDHIGIKSNPQAQKSKDVDHVVVRGVVHFQA